MSWRSPQFSAWLSAAATRTRVVVATTVAVAMLLSGMVLINAVVGNVADAHNASPVNVLANGGFENGFASLSGCGGVGTGWGCFTNGGGVNVGFGDDNQSARVAEGGHSQLITMNTVGMSGPSADRYAGIYQTVKVVDWAEYTLALKGMIRTTVHDGDPWRYRVQVGWTQGATADWTKVANWADVGWDTYYDQSGSGPLSSYSTKFMAEADYVTVYVRVWKKWGVPEETIAVNLDAITLTGLGAGWPAPTPTATATVIPAPGVIVLPTPAPTTIPAPVTVTQCAGPDRVVNGDFEKGFAQLTYGAVGNNWGHFINGGRAAYGFYDEQWSPVIASGSHGQLIEINTKGMAAADGDRYAGIYQTITGLTKGTTYELTVKGLVRGTGVELADYPFEAQWGWTAGANTDWTKATFSALDLGSLYPRTEPGSLGTATVRFTAPDSSMTLFVRSWMKWGIPESEMDLNLDAISLRGCTTTTTQPSTPTNPVVCTYAVKPGDYLGKIAANYGVSLVGLAAVNHIWNYDHIYVGQLLTIPGCTTGGTVTPPPAPKPAPPPVAHRTHTVSAGENLSWIAAWYGVNMYDLARANGISNLNHVWVGQVLIIP